MTNSKDKKPKTVKTMVKEMRRRKNIPTIIPDAIEALDINSTADFTLLNGLMKVKWRKLNKSIVHIKIYLFAIFLAILAGYVYAKR